MRFVVGKPNAELNAETLDELLEELPRTPMYVRGPNSLRQAVAPSR